MPNSRANSGVGSTAGIEWHAGRIHNHLCGVFRTPLTSVDRPDFLVEVPRGYSDLLELHVQPMKEITTNC